MTAGTKIVWNCASILTGNFINKAVNMLILVCLTGYLTPSEFGQYSFVVIYTAFFGVFTDLGLNILLTRDISGHGIDAGYGFGHAIVIRLIFTSVSAVFSLLALALTGYPFDILSLAAASSLSLFFSFRGLFFRTVFDIPFQVHLKMSYPAFINFLNELLMLGGVVWLVESRASLLKLVIGINLINLPGFLCVAFFSTRLIRPRFSVDLKAWRNIIRESMPLGTSAFLEGVFIITPVFILSKLSTDEALGFYSLPFRVVSSLWVVPVAVMMTLLPGMTRDASGSAGVREGFLRGLKLLLFAGVAMALIIDYFSGEVINMFTHGRYPGSAPALSIMIWGTALYFVNTVFFYSFTAAGLQKINTKVWAITSASFLALCMFLIPSRLHMGAAYGYVASLGAGLVVNIFYSYRILGINTLPVITRFLLGGVLAVPVVFFMPFLSFASIPMGMLVYISAVVSMKAVSLKEWSEWLYRKETDNG